MSFLMQQGWDVAHLHSVASLYEEAFGSKFAVAIPDRDQRMRVLAACFVPEFSYVLLHDEQIVGVAGFQTPGGSLTGLSLSGLVRELGALRGVWAGLVLSLFERKARSGELVMDGIVVAASQRGRGLGSQLLNAIVEHAEQSGFDSVRLDVIDTNPRAKQLYERKGFVLQKTEHFPGFKWLIGFSSASTLVYVV